MADWKQYIKDFSTFKVSSEQLEFVKKATKLGSIGLFFDTGVGKTRAAMLYALDLYAKGKIKNVLIVGPKSALAVWPQELENYNVDIPIKYLNYERAAYEYDNRKEWKADLIIADEAHKLKNRNSTQSKFLWKLGEKAKYRVAATGTPQGNCEEDYWAIFRFFDPEVFGTRYKEFDTYFLKPTGWMNKKRVLKKERAEEFKQIIHEYSHRVEINEVAILPEKKVHDIEFELTGDAAEAYEQIIEDNLLELTTGDIEAEMAMTLTTKLQQICSGFIYGEEFCHLFDQQDKVRALLPLIKKGEKIVIFCKFDTEITVLLEALKKFKILIYTGKTRNKDIWREFQETDKYDIFLANLKTGGTGLNLQSAHKLVFYGNTYSYLDYYQAMNRVYRRGQQSNVDIYRLMAKDTVEESIYQVIQSKGKSAKAVLDDYRNKLIR